MAPRESSAGSQSATGQGIERVSTILKALADRARTGARLTDIALATGLSKSTVHRLIGTLTAEGLVETDVKTGLIYLGYAMCVIGSAAANRYGLVNVGHETMEALEKLTEDTIYLSVRAGDDAICIDRVVGSFPIKVLTLNVGDRRPLGVGAGSLALLAALDDGEIGEVIERNAAKLAEYPNYGMDQLHAMVARSRADGYAFNEGRIISGMFAIGVPVRDQEGRPVAALTVAATTNRMEGERRMALVSWITEAANSLGERLSRVGGGRP